MIYEARFPQQWQDEEAEPNFEESPCITTRISDWPEEDQERINGYKGSRNRIYKKFILKSKER